MDKNNKVVAAPKWKDPRGTIAKRFVSNDFGYITHGTLAALQVYNLFDLPPSVTKKLTILDYGCGTGREARTLSVLFNKVVAYDPTVECIEEFRKEIKLCEREFSNIELYTDITKVPVCDVGYSLHVMEHLDEEQSQIMMNNLRQKIKDTVMLSYAARNFNIVSPFLTPKQKKDDLQRNKQAGRGTRWRLIKFGDSNA